jgi:hypothetical protein
MSELEEAIVAIGGGPSTPESLALRRLCSLRPISPACAWHLFSIPTHVSCCVTQTADDTIADLRHTDGVECRVEAYTPGEPFRGILLVGDEAADVLRVGEQIAAKVEAIETLSPYDRVIRFLSILGWSVFDVAHDGNCFFRMLSLAATGSQENHAAFRHRLTVYMMSWPKLTELVEDPEAYVKSMSQNGVWGTEIEITAYAEMSRQFVCVVTVTGDQPSVYTYGQPGNRCSSLHILHSSDHFLLMRPTHMAPFSPLPVHSTEKNM